MFTLKKSLLLFFFLGTISLSLCEQERGADDDQGEVQQEVKRSFLTTVKKLVTNLAALAGTVIDTIKCKVTGGCRT
uniref:Ranatuerin-2Pb n=2 Tax=Lithobates pipiens TaxID=8404 RepID=A0A513ZTP5_LITPI|nr:ranatuerin-2Pb precursor [Lithobates pipiens]